MGLAAAVAALLVQLFLVVLIVRLVFEWVQVLAREWRPRGFVLLVAEVVYTITDPPLKLYRRVIPPVTIGSLRLDLAFIALFMTCWFVLVILALI